MEPHDLAEGIHVRHVPDVLHDHLMASIAAADGMASGDLIIVPVRMIDEYAQANTFLPDA